MDPNTEVTEVAVPSSPLYNPVEGHTFTTGGHHFHICIHEGYNAFGLIGTECNGVGLLSIDKRSIVFDQWACKGVGFDYIESKRAEMWRIIKMSAEELDTFFTTTAGLRLRFNPLEVKKKAPGLSKKLVKEYLEIVQDGGSCSYNEENKAFFHRVSEQLLRKLAKALGLPKGTYSIRHNQGGIAVSGEITLHGESIYVQLEQSCLGASHGFMARTCKGRQDYSGGSNEWFDYMGFLDIPELAEGIKFRLKQPNF